MHSTDLPHGLRHVEVTEILGHDTPHGPQVMELLTGASTAASGLSVALLQVPGGSVARAHRHDHSDICIWLIAGRARTIFGPDMTEWVDTEAGVLGPLLFVPAGVPHAAVNLSPTEPVAALEVRASRDFGADVVLLPQLQHVMDEWGQHAAAGSIPTLGSGPGGTP